MAILVALALSVAAAWLRGVRWALVALALQYLVALYARGAGPDGLAPLYAAGLLVVAELVYWSMELPAAASVEGPMAVLRVRTVAGLALAAAALCEALMVIARAPTVVSGLIATSLGALAAVAAIGLVAALMWRVR